MVVISYIGHSGRICMVLWFCIHCHCQSIFSLLLYLFVIIMYVVKPLLCQYCIVVHILRVLLQGGEGTETS